MRMAPQASFAKRVAEAPHAQHHSILQTNANKSVQKIISDRMCRPEYVRQMNSTWWYWLVTVGSPGVAFVINYSPTAEAAAVTTTTTGRRRR